MDNIEIHTTGEEAAYAPSQPVTIGCGPSIDPAAYDVALAGGSFKILDSGTIHLFAADGEVDVINPVHVARVRIWGADEEQEGEWEDPKNMGRFIANYEAACLGAAMVLDGSGHELPNPLPGPISGHIHPVTEAMMGLYLACHNHASLGLRLGFACETEATAIKDLAEWAVSQTMEKWERLSGSVEDPHLREILRDAAGLISFVAGYLAGRSAAGEQPRPFASDYVGGHSAARVHSCAFTGGYTAGRSSTEE